MFMTFEAAENRAVKKRLFIAEALLFSQIMYEKKIIFIKRKHMMGLKEKQRREKNI